eukprot:2127972-Rhodomonas_salina.2
MNLPEQGRTRGDGEETGVGVWQDGGSEKERRRTREGTHGRDWRMGLREWAALAWVPGDARHWLSRSLSFR